MRDTFSYLERWLLIIALVILGIGSRLIPHPPAATAMTAVILASAYYLGPSASVLVSLTVLLLSDMVLGTYELPVMISVYGSFLAIAALGMLLVGKQSVTRRVALIASGSIVFFLITNAAVWFFTPWYPKDFSGLLMSYTLALPFLRNMLLGDFIYTAALFGALSVLFTTVLVKRNAYAH